MTTPNRWSAFQKMFPVEEKAKKKKSPTAGPNYAKSFDNQQMYADIVKGLKTRRFQDFSEEELTQMNRELNRKAS